MANLFDLSPAPTPSAVPVSKPAAAPANPVAEPSNVFEMGDPERPAIAGQTTEEDLSQTAAAQLISESPDMPWEQAREMYRKAYERDLTKGLGGGLLETGKEIASSLGRAASGIGGIVKDVVTGEESLEKAKTEATAILDAGLQKTLTLPKAFLQDGAIGRDTITRATGALKLTDEELDDRLLNDLAGFRNIKRRVELAEGPAAIMAAEAGIDPKSFDRKRIEEVSDWVDPTLLVPLGWGEKAAANVLKKGLLRRGAAAVVDTALHQVDNLAADAVKAATKKGATAAVKEAVTRSPLAAAAMAAIPAYALTGDPMWALASAVAGKTVLSKRGAVLAAGKQAVGPLARAATGAARLVEGPARGAVMGMIGMTPFVLGARSPDDVQSMLLTGGLLGGGTATGRLFVDKLRPHSWFRTERVGNEGPKMDVADFGSNPDWDAAHRSTISNLTNESHNFVETVRQYVKDQTGREVYVLDDAQFAKVADEHGKPHRVQGFVTPDGTRAFVRVSQNAFGHEALGHLWFEALDDSAKKEIFDGVTRSYTPEQFAEFKQSYTDKLTNGFMLSDVERGGKPDLAKAREEASRTVTDDYVAREIIAENASAILSSVPVSQFGTPINFARALHLKMEGLAEAFGARGLLKPAPQTNLGLNPSARLADIILNVAESSRLETDRAPVDGAAFRPGDPIEGMGEVRRVVPGKDGAHAYEVVDPATGEVRTVPESELQSPVTDGGMRPFEPGEPSTVTATTETAPGTVEWPAGSGLEPGREPAPRTPAQKTPEVARPPERGADTTPEVAQQPPFPENQRGTGAALNRAIGVDEPLSAQAKRDIAESAAITKGDQTKMTQAYAAVQAAVKKGRADTPALRMKMRVAEADGGKVNLSTREKEQLQRDAGRRKEVVEEKLIVPSSEPKFNEKSGTLTFFGFDLSRPMNTAKKAFEFAEKNGIEMPYSGITDPALSPDLAAYTRNHANGFLGDGRAFPTNLAARLEIRPTPGFVPVPIARERASFLNMLMGNLNTSSDRALGTARAVGGEIFKLEDGKFETNALRKKFRDTGAPTELLDSRSRNSATAQFRIDRIDSIEGATDVGYRQPNTLAVEAGFMPEVFENEIVPGTPFRYRGVWEIIPGQPMRMFDALKDVVGPKGEVLVGKFSTVDAATLERIGFSLPELSDEPMQRREYAAYSPELAEPPVAGKLDRHEGLTKEELARVTAAGLDPVWAAEIKRASQRALAGSEVPARDSRGGAGVVGVDAPARKSSSEVQFARPEGPLPDSIGGDGPLKLIHWSANSALQNLDPRHFGKGKANPRDLRGSPRVYFFEQGSGYGADEGLVTGNGKSVYGATVARDRIYDGNADPLGYWNMVNREAADQLLKDNGYAGMAVSGRDGRNTVEIFDSVDVGRLADDQTAFAPEKLPTKKAAEENIRKWGLSKEEAAQYRDFLDAQRGLDAETLPAELVIENDRPKFAVDEEGKVEIRARSQKYDLIQSPEILQIRDKYEKAHAAQLAKLEETRKSAPRERRPAIDKKIADLKAKWESDGQNRWVEEGTDLLADRLVEEYRKSENDAAVQAGIGWYSDMRSWLQKRFGAGIELFSQLLGATSARTPVDENFRQASDALAKFSRGEFDELLQRFDDHVKAAEKAHPDDPAAMRREVLKFSEVPVRSNGKKFNANSTKVLHALYGNWIDLTEGPKTPNFAGNLSGRTTRPTIDVWAARTARRLLFQNKEYNAQTGRVGGKTNRWRLQPSVETGVEFKRLIGNRQGGDFFFAQDAYQKAADRLGINGDDLQAFMWFHEKQVWDDKGWTNKTGAKKSSFEEEAGKLDLGRYQAGVTTFTAPETFDRKGFDSSLKTLRDTLRDTEGLRYGRAEESQGLYSGSKEPTFDVEFVLDRSADPTPVLQQVIKIGESANQYDVFLSRVVDVDHPNARPGLEIGFKTAEDTAFVSELTRLLQEQGVDGFTVSSDRRGRPVGLRAQFIPEISARWGDSGVLDVAKFNEAATLWGENATNALNNLSDDLRSRLSHTTKTAFDTRVFGREEYSGNRETRWGETRLEEELGRRRAILEKRD